MLKFALLGLLLRQSMTGYDLATVIRKSINFIWPAQLSQIYRTLGQLEDDGLVVSEVVPQQGRPDRRVYSVTESGQRAFESWAGELVTELDPVRVPFLVRFFFGGTRPPQDLVTQLRVMRDLHLKARDQLANEIPGDIAEFAASDNSTELDPLIWDAVRRAGEMVSQTWVDWADETIERLERATGQSPPTDG
jgi:PadR family transcriptional regulator AphA